MKLGDDHGDDHGLRGGHGSVDDYCDDHGDDYGIRG